MSLFGSTPPGDSPSMHSSFARSRHSLFDDEPTITRSNSNSLFNDDEAASGPGSPWDMPTPRKQQSRAELVRSLLPVSAVPESYTEIFETVTREDGTVGRITSAAAARTLAASKLDADQQAKIIGIVVPGGADVLLGRNEFNVLLALIGLAQEGEVVSLDSVDERRRRKGSLPPPVPPPYLIRLVGAVDAVVVGGKSAVTSYCGSQENKAN